MTKANFKAEDIQKFEKTLTRLEFVHPTVSHIIHNVNIVKNETDFDIWRIISFLGRIICFKRPEYLTKLAFNLEVIWLPNSEDSYWLKDEVFAGVTEPETKWITLKLKKNVVHSNLSVAWLLLHEFRHLIQFTDKKIESNVNNDNWNLFLKYLMGKGNDSNTLNHVLHEVAPYEIDANTFACELLEIDYPGSKFQVTDYTLGLLK